MQKKSQQYSHVSPFARFSHVQSLPEISGRFPNRAKNASTHIPFSSIIILAVLPYHD
jgi:hypothetical protein